MATYLIKRIDAERDSLINQFTSTQAGIGFFYLDNLLPESIALQLYHAFPEQDKMTLKKSMKEDKYVGAQMNVYDAVLEEAIFAFQDVRVVNRIGDIFGLSGIQPDESLYAGGLSSMQKGQFLNPHLDNSHDKDRKLWRVLNLLYYVSPGWKLEYGGNLELWPAGLKSKPVTIESRFNRLVVMATHGSSLHGVTPVGHEGARHCISNYYFAERPLKESDEFHVTSFRARPGEYIKDAVLKTDTWLRMRVRSIFKKGIVRNPHVYKKEE